MKNTPTITDYRDAEIRTQKAAVGRDKQREIDSAPLADKPAPTRVRGVSID